MLELNLTLETLSFSPSLGSIPNRGSGTQGDIFLNGVPYLQTISDVTVPSQPVGIHFEPGIWLAVPATTDPRRGRNGRAHGVDSARHDGRGPGNLVHHRRKARHTGRGHHPVFDRQPRPRRSRSPARPRPTTRHARIPQNLAPFITAGTITQAMLTDPNTLLRNHIASQTITSTTIISISSDPASPLFGGGTDNIAFLLGDPTAATPNAQTVKMDATFWIETVEFTIEVPVFEPGQPPLVIPAPTGAEGQPVPRFLVNPPIRITAPRYITVQATQIQYSQQVFLNFNGLSWPHVSVATLVPSNPIPVPPSVWA